MCDWMPSWSHAFCTHRQNGIRLLSRLTSLIWRQWGEAGSYETRHAHITASGNFIPDLQALELSKWQSLGALASYTLGLQEIGIGESIHKVLYMANVQVHNIDWQAFSLKGPFRHVTMKCSSWLYIDCPQICVHVRFMYVRFVII